MSSGGGQGFLHGEQMQEIIASEQDPITAQLMVFVYNTLISCIGSGSQAPTGSFDLGFFMHVVQQFARDHEALRTILEGKGNEYVWIEEPLTETEKKPWT